MNVVICSLGLIFIPVEDMTKQLIGLDLLYNTIYARVLMTENIGI